MTDAVTGTAPPGTVAAAVDDLLDRHVQQTAIVPTALGSPAKTRGFRRLRALRKAALLTPDTTLSSIYLPIKPAGYAIATEDLEFDVGDPNADQITRASQFAELMNQIPIPGEGTWIPSGDLVWKVWNAVLTAIELPIGGDHTTIMQMRATLETSARANLNGDSYCPTTFSPDRFWEAAASWSSIQVAGGEAGGANDTLRIEDERSGTTPISVPAQDLDVSAEMVLVTLERDWWSPFLLRSRGWRLGAAALVDAPSHGTTPPSGSLAIYPTGFMVLRNVQLSVAPGSTALDELMVRAATAKEISLGSLVLKGGASDLLAGDAVLTADSPGVLHTPSMQIVGFSCAVLPKSPNPAPGLHWG